MSRHDRSRSPGGGNTEWISRQIVGFGRYKDKRPSGLRVDDDGTMTLEDLMGAWGKHNNLTKETIVAAVQKHMFYSEAGRDGMPNLRFTLGQSEDGKDYTIKVHPGRGAATPARNGVRGRAEQRDAQPEQERQRDASDAKSAQPQKEVNWWESSNSSWDHGGDAWKEDDKWKKDEADSAWKSDDKWQKKDEEGDKWWEKRDDGDKQNGERKWYGRQTGEKVQRWLAYVLKKGYDDLRITLGDDGSAALSDIAWAISKNRQNFGVNTEEELRNLIEETDLEGRFVIDDAGRIKKLPRGQRSKREAPPEAERQSHAQPQAPDARRKNERGSRRQVTTPPRETRRGSERKPPRPPGNGWTRYQDEGVLWWYYDGPLGKWWCQENENNEPESPAVFDETE